MPDPQNNTLPTTPKEDLTVKKQKLSADIASFNDSLSSGMSKDVSVNARNPYAELQPFSYDPKSTEDINKNYERYYSHPSFKKLGFNPWRDNESLYASQGSNFGDVARATISAMKLAVTGFKAPLRSYADIFTGDALNVDESSAREMKYQNVVGMSTKGGFTGFTSNLAVNSGFSVGFMAEAIAEQALLTAGTVLTGGAEAPLQIARAAKTAKDFGTVFKTIEGLSAAAKNLEHYSAAKVAYDSFKTIGKFVNPLEHTMSALNESKNLSSMAKFSNTAGGFFRDVSAANFTLSEAKTEGASTQFDTEDQLKAQWKDGYRKYQEAVATNDFNNVEKYSKYKSGPVPSYQNLIQIKQTAAAAGDKTLAWNIPAIFLTNKITFAPLFKSFTSSSEKLLRDGLKIIEKDGKELGKATFGERIKASLKPKNLAKLPITYFKENLSEGIQETTQDIVSGSAKQYYTDLFNTTSGQALMQSQSENQTPDISGIISNNVKNQFSGKGFETFASGFFMGGLLRIAGAPVSAARLAFSEYKGKKQEYLDKTLEAGNALYKDPIRFFAPQSLNFSSTSSGVENQTFAENEGSQKDWSDFDDKNTWSHITTALDTGTFDVALDKLRSVKTMTPEAIQETYGLNGNQVLSKIDKIIGRAEGLKSRYEKWNERASNPFNPKMYAKDTPEYEKEALSFVSWEAAKKSAIFQEYSLSRNLDRVSAISRDILKTEEFKGLNPNDVSILFDPAHLENEVRLLGNEVEVLQDSEIPGDKTSLKQKRTKLDRLIDFREGLNNYYRTQRLEALTDEEKKAAPELVEKLTGKDYKKTNRAKIKRAYESYISHLGTTQPNVVSVTTPNLDASFEQLLDLHNLKDENFYFSSAINLLSNPKGFTDHYQRLHKTFKDLYANRSDVIKNSIQETQKRIELNVGLLRPLYDAGFVVDADALDKLVDKEEIPSEFYDINSKQVVDDRDPYKYQQFKTLVDNYVSATRETPPVEETTTETKTATEEPTTKLAGEEVIVETEEPPLSIDIVKKFNDVTNQNQLDDLVDEMKSLMLTTTHQERKRAGLSSKNIDEKIAEKEIELSRNVTYENLNVGDIVTMQDSKKGNMKVITKLKNRLVLQKLGENNIKAIVSIDNLKKSIKSKYSDKMIDSTTKATPQEKVNVKQNVAKQEKLTDNRDLVTEIVEDAFKNEKRVLEEFENELGCK